MSFRIRIVSSTKDVFRLSFGKHLIVTNTLTCGILMAAGDLLQQRIERVRYKQQRIDWARTGRMFIVGTVLQGLPHHYWYIWLDRLVPKNDSKGVILKILADQVFAAPYFAFSFFFGVGILEDKRLSECWKEFVAKFPLVYLFDWMIWPPSQYINFTFVPQPFRVIYVNLVTLIWDVFLSFMKHFDRFSEVSF